MSHHPDDVLSRGSTVVQGWLWNVHSWMPPSMRDQRWQDLLRAEGPYRPDAEVLSIMRERMWLALSMHQPSADDLGYGDLWRDLLERRVPSPQLLSCVKASGADLALSSPDRDTTLHSAARGISWASCWAVKWSKDLSDQRLQQWEQFDPYGTLEMFSNNAATKHPASPYKTT